MAVIPNEICHVIENHSFQPGTSTTYNIILIPGNPGLIAYYGIFLEQLGVLFRQSRICHAENVQFEIIGRSLRGFQVSCSADCPKPPVGLNQQIDYIEQYIHSLSNTYEDKDRAVILIGHSVGAFILIEILRRSHSGARNIPSVKLRGGICLFPTIVDIGKSQSGRRIGWLIKLPGFALFVGGLAKVLLTLLPLSLVVILVRLFTQLPEDAVSTTVAFLRSPEGVRQALHMARDEMNMIKEDRWGEEIWGSPQFAPPPLYLYFGGSDHWVADRTRDKLIIDRAYEGGEENSWKPRMEIDNTGIAHGFCTSHGNSLAIAKKCLEYVEEIVLGNRGARGP